MSEDRPGRGPAAGASPGRSVVRRHPEAPPAVRWIVRTLEDAGFETWAVGGAVRDVLLGLPSGDWDLATRATPGQVRKLFRRTVPVGVEHGTVGVLARDGTLYEVTTFRRDVETTGRHAVVTFADTLEEDLARRDFTINAVAWHPLGAELFDPFGGVEDLEAGLLRTVGDPALRFREDYLRVLRALRFAGRFSLDVHPSTWRALKEAVPGLDVLSRERVREELLKVLSGDPRPERALRLWERSGALEAVAPELAATVGLPLPDGPPGLDAWSYGVAVAAALPPSRPVLRVAALLLGAGLPDGGEAPGGEERGPDAGQAGAAARARWRTGLGAHRAAALLVRLRFSNAEIDRVTSLVAAGAVPPDPAAPGAPLRRWLATVGASRLPDLARLWIARGRALALPGEGEGACREALEAWRAARAELRRGPALSVRELALGGRDLARMGMKPGPRFGRVLDALLERVLDDPSLNERETLERIVASELVEAEDGTWEGPP